MSTEFTDLYEERRQRAFASARGFGWGLVVGLGVGALLVYTLRSPLVVHVPSPSVLLRNGPNW